ncbi:MAG: peptidoglycan-binding protein [Robiginitomaculum sp.]|nr:MAG: peptidoglycan-binding protein [Robiginitomaculum sp.]
MAAAGTSALLLAACGTTQTTSGSGYSSSESARIAELQAQLLSAQSQNASLSSQVSSYQSSSSTSGDSIAIAAGYPPNALPGQCFSRILIPELTETIAEQVIDLPVSTELRIIAAEYEFQQEQILVKEATTRYHVIPATYETITEQVLVQPEMTISKVIAAVYEEYEEQVLVRPAFTTWKPGAGLIGDGGYRRGNDGRLYGPDGSLVQTIIQPTGEILCKVEVPPKYKTVSRKRLVSAEHTQETLVQAKYETITKQVIAVPPRVEEEVVAAEYTTIRVRREISPARTDTITIPATYKTIEKIRIVSGGNLEWREVICDTNSTPELISEVQTALSSRGYSTGRVDGVFGMSTLRAMEKFQHDNGLIVGQLTMETMDALSVAH